MKIEKQLIKTVTHMLGMKIGEVKPDSTLKSLGMDSLDEIECLMAIEEEFNVEIQDSDAWKITSIKDAVGLVKEYLPNNES